MSLSALFINIFWVSQSQLILESPGSFLKTSMTEPHQQDQLNQKFWDRKQALVLFFVLFCFVLIWVILLCTRLRMMAVTNSELTPFLFPKVMIPKLPYFLRPPTLPLILLFLADGYFFIFFPVSHLLLYSSLLFLFQENMCILRLTHCLHFAVIIL